MKVTTQTLENRQVEMAIEVEDERVQQALQQTAKQISQKINIPGFRKGKAPYAIVVRTIGEDALYREMFDELAPKLLQEALLEANLDPFRPGEMTDLTMKPLSFKVTFSLPPVVDLGDYRSLRIPFETPTMPEESINEVLESIRQRNSILEPIGDGPAEWGQVATLNIRGQMGEEDLNFGEFSDESGNISLLLDEQKESLLPGFSQHLIGMKVGDEKEFDLDVAEDFEDESLRGKTVSFAVKLVELKKVYIPPLDDALAQTTGNYETLEQLRSSLQTAMEQNALRRAEAEYADQCVDKLAELAQIDFPPVLIEEELDKILQDVDERLRAQSKMSLGEMLKMKKQTQEQYRDEMRPRAVKRIRQGLALGHFIEAEALLANKGQMDDDTIEKAIARLVAICKGEQIDVETGDQPALEEQAVSTES